MIGRGKGKGKPSSAPMPSSAAATHQSAHRPPWTKAVICMCEVWQAWALGEGVPGALEEKAAHR